MKVIISKKNPVDVIYILGAGHCGSTLLNLCLDQHSSIIGLSEIISLNRKKPGWSGDRYALNNHFWSEVDQVMNEKYSETLREVPFNLRPSLPSYYLALQRNRTACSCILNVSGKSIICDSSKDSKRLHVLFESKLLKLESFTLCVMVEQLYIHIDENMEAEYLAGLILQELIGHPSAKNQAWI